MAASVAEPTQAREATEREKRGQRGGGGGSGGGESSAKACADADTRGQTGEREILRGEDERSQQLRDDGDGGSDQSAEGGGERVGMCD